MTEKSNQSCVRLKEETRPERLSDSSSSAVIVVKKSKKEPDPPRRSVSLLGPQPTKPSSKRYSCPALGMTAQNPSSSSSTFSFSPPLVRTSTITGPDPLGWKVRHKPRTGAGSQARAGRLSLQIPLSDVLPEGKSQLSPNSDFSSHPKPFRRYNSDSLAFLRSSGTVLPVTLEELSTVELRRAFRASDPDDVFEEDVKTTERNIKQPPPVPIKSEMARQVAQLIAFSRELSIEAKPNH